MAVGDVYELTLLGKNSQAPVVLVLHYETTVSLGNKELEMLYLFESAKEAFFNKTLVNDLLNFCHETVIFEEIKIRDVRDKTQGRDDLLEPPAVGQLLSFEAPNQLAMLGRKRTALIGRSYQGRNYLPVGNRDSLTANGQYGDIFTANVLDWYASIYLLNLPLVPNFFYQLVIWSEKIQVATVVETFGVVQDPRTQRRRSY